LGFGEPGLESFELVGTYAAKRQMDHNSLLNSGVRNVRRNSGPTNGRLRTLLNLV
jgi:hypothetical protein